MFTIRCEQYVMQAEAEPPVAADGGRFSIVRFLNYSPLPIVNPQTGDPVLFQIGSCQVEIVLDPAERARLIALLQDDEAEAASAMLAPTGEPRPAGDDVVDVRCGRLQPHPSHTWPNEGVTAWCDGLVWTVADGLPDPTPVGGD